MSRARRIVWRLVLGILGVGCTVSAWRWIDSKYNEPVRIFEKTVHAGMTRDQVLASAGEPRERLAGGTVEPPWGGSPERLLQEEAWVYYFGLGSIHRVTVLFRRNAVVGVLVETT